MANENVDIIDEETSELMKALEDMENMSKAKKDGEFVRKGGFEYMKKADGSYEAMDDDAPDYNDDDDGLEKSLYEDVIEYDASEEVEELVKSVDLLKSQNIELRDMVKSIADSIQLQSNLMKSMGSQVLSDSTLLKAMKDAPLPRATSVKNIHTIDRFEKSIQAKLKNVTPSTLMKSMIENDVDPQKRATVNTVFRKSGNDIGSLEKSFPEILDMMAK